MDNDENGNETITLNIGNNKNKNKVMTLSKFQIMESFEVDNSHSTFGSFLIIGKRESGKTVFIKNLIMHLMRFDKIKNTVIFNHNQNQYIDIVNNVDNVEPVLTINNLEKIIEMQSEKHSAPLLLVIENISLDGKITSSPYFLEILKNKKELKITIIMSLQQPIGLCPKLRGHIDFVSSFKEDIPQNIHKLREYYFSMIPTDKILEKLLCKLTLHSCLISVRLKNNTRLENCVQYYKVNDIDFSNFKQINIISIRDIEVDNMNLNSINCKDIIRLIKINNEKIEELQEKNNYLVNMLNYKITNV